jgi:hypothetical protein
MDHGIVKPPCETRATLKGAWILATGHSALRIHAELSDPRNLLCPSRGKDWHRHATHHKQRHRARVFLLKFRLREACVIAIDAAYFRWKSRVVAGVSEDCGAHVPRRIVNAHNRNVLIDGA